MMSCLLRLYSVLTALILCIFTTAPKGFSYVSVDGAVCMRCHSSGDFYDGMPDGSGLHAVIDHGTCLTCHQGIPQRGNVAASACTTCHGSTCRTVERHENAYAARCIKCHPLCSTQEGAEEQQCPAETLYGTDAPQTLLFRQFRDRVLLQTRTGALLVRSYYRMSPLIAAAVKNPGPWRRMIKGLFDAAAAFIAPEANNRDQRARPGFSARGRKAVLHGSGEFPFAFQRFAHGIRQTAPGIQDRR